MDWAVAVSPCAVTGGALSAETASAGPAMFPGARRCAAARSAGAFLIDDMHREFVALDKS